MCTVEISLFLCTSTSSFSSLLLFVTSFLVTFFSLNSSFSRRNFGICDGGIIHVALVLRGRRKGEGVVHCVVCLCVCVCGGGGEGWVTVNGDIKRRKQRTLPLMLSLRSRQPFATSPIPPMNLSLYSDSLLEKRLNNGSRWVSVCGHVKIGMREKGKKRGNRKRGEEEEKL